MAITFIGATGTVTGSHHVLDVGDGRLLLDCGMYQGERSWRERNWQPFPVPPSSIDAVLLSHAHVDHTGYLPRLMRDGFHGPVYGSPSTRDLCALLLPDSARLMEEEAEYRNRKGATRYRPALPLYTEGEAERAADRINPLAFHAPRDLPGGARLTLRRAGHLLGSAMIDLAVQGRRLLFTGDLGRTHPVLLNPREAVNNADYLVLESTYGDRVHEEHDPRGPLSAAVQRIARTRGALVIPSFAVGRTQEVLFLLRDLEEQGRIPSLPVYVDSPMALAALAAYRAAIDRHAGGRRAQEPVYRCHAVAQGCRGETMTQETPAVPSAEAAQRLLRDGVPLPAGWAARLTGDLRLDRAALTDLAPLAGMTGLSGLFLNRTMVRDVAPLAGLTGLGRLSLKLTRVSDVAPLAGLTGLTSLILSFTPVADIAPLAGMTALESLYLTGTLVADLAPLAGLTRLERLDLGGTQVVDLTPLAGLTRLRSLELASTAVADLVPLAGLAALEHLDLGETQVTDLSPLRGLPRLRRLDVRGAPVTDLSAVPDGCELVSALTYRRGRR